MEQACRLPHCRPISRVGLGTWATFGDGVDFTTARRVLFAALDAGINYVDTAPSYASGIAEEWLGRLLTDTDRSQVVISTKVYFAPSGTVEGLGREALLRAVDSSLKRLRCESIDLLYCHRADPDTPLVETLQALSYLRQQGKIRAWGVSRWPAKLTLQAADSASKIGLPPPTAAQEPYNRLHPAAAAALRAELQSVPVPIIGYSVLARGTLTGKYLDHVPTASRAARSRDCPNVWKADDAQVARIRKVLALADREGLSAAALLIGDALRSGPCAAVLTAASSPEQVAEIAKGVALAQDEALMQEIEAVFRDPAH